MRRNQWKRNAFILNYNDWQYLVTARHVVETISGNRIDIFHDGEWKSLEVMS